MNNSLSLWKLKKAGIMGLLVAVSVGGGIVLYFDFGSKLLLIPIVLILLLIWVYGRRVYACPHCKTPIDLRLHLHAEMKCTKCGKSVMN